MLDATKSQLPDQFKDIPDLPNRSIIATDVTYQTESSHFSRVILKEGGYRQWEGLRA